jgi:hypothetical protein
MLAAVVVQVLLDLPEEALVLAVAVQELLALEVVEPQTLVVVVVEEEMEATVFPVVLAGS